jgi:hypothetical protein
LEVLILHDFKSFEPEVLILGGFKSLFPEVLILVGFKPGIMSMLQKYEKFLEVLILDGLAKHDGKEMLILKGLRERGCKAVNFIRRLFGEGVCSLLTQTS